MNAARKRGRPPGPRRPRVQDRCGGLALEPVIVCQSSLPLSDDARRMLVLCDRWVRRVKAQDKRVRRELKAARLAP